MSNIAARVGFLRIVMALTSLACALAALIDPAVGAGSWRFLATYVAPTVAVLIMWVLPWDILMARLSLLGKDPPDPQRYQTIRTLDLSLLVLLVLAWGPFFLLLIRGGL